MEHALNWMWQGTAIAVATYVLLRALARTRARHRFVLCGVALGAVLVIPVLQLGPQAERADAAPTVIGAAGAAPLLALPVVWWTRDGVLLAAFVLWIAAQSVRAVREFGALRELRAGCTAFPARVASCLPHWGDVSRRGRPARLVVSRDVRTAAVLGGRVPVIAVSPTLIERLASRDLDRVLVHEWAHIQRRDDVLNAAQMAVRIVAGWHPAVWWLERQLQREREAACDETVVDVCGSRKQYAASLAALARVPASGTYAPALGALSAGRLEERVRRILAHGALATPSRSVAFAGGAALLLTALSLHTARVRVVGMADVLAVDDRVGGAGRTGAIAAAAAPAALGTYDEAAAPLADERDPAATRGHRVPMKREAPHGRRHVIGHVLTAGPHAPSSADVAARAAETPGPQAAALDLDPDESRAPLEGVQPVELADVAPLAPASSLPSLTKRPATWQTVASAGTAVGRGAREAGTGTAGFFTRFGKRIAASF